MIVPPFDPENFPTELTHLCSFVAWRYEERDGKATKIPINIHNGRMALTNAPSTWATLDEALPYARAQGYGVGFVFAATDPYVGVDLDKCIGVDGTIAGWAWAIVRGLDSYTEASPSGTGLHCFIRATLPVGGKRKGAIEMYDRLRFFTLTGTRVRELPAEVHPRQSALDTLHASIFPPVAKPSRPNGPTPLRDWDDAEIVRRAMAASNGHKFAQLWLDRGHAYTSESEADAALCSMLAFWIGPDPARLDDIFRQSARMRPKWERASYRDKTIALALQGATFYSPSALAVTSFPGAPIPDPRLAALPGRQARSCH